MRTIRLEKVFAALGILLPILSMVAIYFYLPPASSGDRSDLFYFMLGLWIVIHIVLCTPLIHILFKVPDSIVQNELIRVGFYVVLIPLNIPIFWSAYERIVFTHNKEFMISILSAATCYRLIEILALRFKWNINKHHLNYGYWILYYQFIIAWNFIMLIP